MTNIERIQGFAKRWGMVYMKGWAVPIPELMEVIKKNNEKEKGNNKLRMKRVYNRSKERSQNRIIKNY